MKSEDIHEAEGRLEFRRLLQGSVETVWRFLVDDELRGKWLCRGAVEPREGGNIEFKFDPENYGQERPPNLPEDVLCAVFSGVVTTYTPPNILAFTWPGEDGESATQVTITLTAEGVATRLHLVHERLSESKHLVSAAAGWHAHLEQLECHLARQLSPNFWTRHEELEAQYRESINQPGVESTKVSAVNQPERGDKKRESMNQSWKPGRGKLGFLHPLLGSWRAVDPDTPMGKVICIRTYTRTLNGKFIQLTADWDIGNGKKTYQEMALYGVSKDKIPSFWSFTSDGGHSVGQLADVTTMHPEAKGFEAEMPAGLARFGFWPIPSGMVWAAEAKTKKGWQSMIHHECERLN